MSARSFAITPTTFLDCSTFMDTIEHFESETEVDTDEDFTDEDFSNENFTNENSAIFAQAVMQLHHMNFNSSNTIDSLNTSEPFNISEPSNTSEIALNLEEHSSPVFHLHTPLKVTHPEISTSLRSKIRSFRHLANWLYKRIAAVTAVAVSTVHRIYSLSETPRKSRPGRVPLIMAIQCKELIELVTSSAENRQEHLHKIAYQC